MLDQDPLPQNPPPQQPAPQNLPSQQSDAKQPLPQRSLPQQPRPQQPDPQQPLLQQSDPQQPLRQQPGPQQSLPQQSLPQQSLPQQPLPQQSHPQQPLLQQSLPQQSHPQQLDPPNTVPQQPLPQYSEPLRSAEKGRARLTDSDGDGRGHDDDVRPTAVKPRHRMDTGWAWVIDAGVFINLAIVVGIQRSYGLFYVEMVDKYQLSASAISLIGATLNATFSIGAVLAMTFGLSVMSERQCVMVAVIMGSIAFSLSCLVTSFPLLVLTLGAIPGATVAMTYGPSFVLLGKYFRRHLTLAQAIANTGTSVGSFVVPYLVRVILDRYSFPMGLLVIGGVHFNMLICAALFRPVDPKDVPPLANSLQHSDSEVEAQDFDREEKNEDARLLNHSVRETGIGSSALSDNKSVVKSSPETADEDQSVDREQKNEDVDVLNHRVHGTGTGKSSSSPSGKISAVRNSPETDHKNKGANAEEARETTRSESDINDQKVYVNSERIKNDYQLSPIKKDLDRILQDQDSSKGSRFYSSLQQITPQGHRINVSSSEKHLYSSLQNFPLSRSLSELTSPPETVLIPLYALQTYGSRTNSLQASATNVSEPKILGSGVSIKEKQDDSQTKKPPIFCNVQVCKNLPVWGLLAHQAFGLLYGIVGNNFLPLWAREIGLSDAQATFLLMLIGGLDIVSRLLPGIVAHRGLLKPHQMVIICMTLVGLLFQILTLFRTYEAMVGFCAVLGCLSGVFYSMTEPVVIEYVGLEGFRVVLGLLQLCNGVSAAASFPLIGALKDVTGTYTTSFHYLGATALVSAGVLAALPFLCRLQEKLESSGRQQKDAVIENAEVVVPLTHAD